MRKFAFLKNNTVVDIQELDSDQYQIEVSNYDAVIDIHDFNDCPEIGWILVGNTLMQDQTLPENQDLDYIQQESQQKFGQKLLIPYVNKLGGRNLKLARDGVQINVSTFASQLSLLKLLLETGALKTARGLCYQMKSIHTNHSDILNEVIVEITNFLIEKGWN